MNYILIYLLTFYYFFALFLGVASGVILQIFSFHSLPNLYCAICKMYEMCFLIHLWFSSFLGYPPLIKLPFTLSSFIQFFNLAKLCVSIQYSTTCVELNGMCPQVKSHTNGKLSAVSFSTCGLRLNSHLIPLLELYSFVWKNQYNRSNPTISKISSNHLLQI